MDVDVGFSIGYTADYAPIWILGQHGLFLNNNLRIFKTPEEVQQFPLDVILQKGISFKPIGEITSGTITFKRLAIDEEPQSFGVMDLWYKELGVGWSTPGKIYFEDFVIRQAKTKRVITDMFMIDAKKVWRGHVRPCFKGETCSPGVKPEE